MSFKMNVKSDEPLEPGVYSAVLRSVEEKDTKFGERLLWIFDLPERGGAEIAGFTSRSSSRRAFAFQRATALEPSIADQKSWGADDVVGRECTLVVGVYESAQGKKNKVIEVRPLQAGADS